MSEHAASPIENRTVSTVVQASVEQCYEVGVDVLAYPQWIEGIRTVEVESANADGSPEQVRFEAFGLGRNTSYVLRYDLSGAPNRLGWSLIEGDLTRAIEGSYTFTDVTAEFAQDSSPGPSTEVRYDLTIDLAVPLPGFVKRRAEDKIIEAALRRFKTHVESKTMA